MSATGIIFDIKILHTTDRNMTTAHMKSALCPCYGVITLKANDDAAILFRGEKCIGAGMSICPNKAILVVGGSLETDPGLCEGCRL